MVQKARVIWDKRSIELLLGIIIGLVVYIWQDYRIQQAQFNQELRNVYNQLEVTVDDIQLEQSVIKGYIQQRDNINLDSVADKIRWRKAYNKAIDNGYNNPRGENIDIEFVPEEGNIVKEIIK